MAIEEMKVRDAFRITPSQLPDNRGLFFEAWRLGGLAGGQRPATRPSGRSTSPSPGATHCAASTAPPCRRARRSW